MAAPANAAPWIGLPQLKSSLPEWLPLIVGLLAMFVPTFVDLFQGVWATEAQAHGPIILALSLWLIWRNWPAMMARSGAGGASAFAWPVLCVALLMYVLGRSQHVLLLEIGSFIWTGVAVVLLKRGGVGLRALWFPFFFMLFMVPLPGQIVSMLTMPMKMAVSYVVEHLLFLAGFPIARTGVILQIGHYQLLVADACAGLQTLLTLEALGLFYLNVVRHTSAVRNVTLALMIVPISFLANVIRVIVLTLITYYFGDAAGQGFLHGFAGMVLFLTALSLILSVDSLLQWGLKRRSAGPAKAQV